MPTSETIIESWLDDPFPDYDTEPVMLDRDLAILYGVETKRLKEQVRRNITRFPDDFMFVLTKKKRATTPAKEAKK